MLYIDGDITECLHSNSHLQTPMTVDCVTLNLSDVEIWVCLQKIVKIGLGLNVKSHPMCT